MSGIRPTNMVHVAYRTRRFEQMVRWYEIVFGAKVQYQNPAIAFLTYDSEHHRFAFANLDILKPESSEKDRRGLIGVDHLADTNPWLVGELSHLVPGLSSPGCARSVFPNNALLTDIFSSLRCACAAC